MLLRVDLPQQVTQQAGVQQPDGRAAAEGRVGARPCVPDRHHAGRDRIAVDDQAAVTVLDAGHHVDAGDRLAVAPVRRQRVPGQGRVEVDGSRRPRSALSRALVVSTTLQVPLSAGSVSTVTES